MARRKPRPGHAGPYKDLYLRQLRINKEERDMVAYLSEQVSEQKRDAHTRQQLISTYETLLINYATHAIRVQSESKNLEPTATK